MCLSRLERKAEMSAGIFFLLLRNYSIYISLYIPCMMLAFRLGERKEKAKTTRICLEKRKEAGESVTVMQDCKHLPID